MDVIFLDIDGVLNHDDHMARIESNELISLNQWWKNAFDRECVRQLNRIVNATGAKVVLSSSWRRHYELEEMNRMLQDVGFEHTLIDKTPNFDRRPGRGEEIQHWIDEHDVDNFVVLDDSLDMYPVSHRWIQTRKDDYGLKPELADKAIEMLKE